MSQAINYQSSIGNKSYQNDENNPLLANTDTQKSNSSAVTGLLDVKSGNSNPINNSFSTSNSSILSQIQINLKDPIIFFPKRKTNITDSQTKNIITIKTSNQKSLIIPEQKGLDEPSQQNKQSEQKHLLFGNNYKSQQVSGTSEQQLIDQDQLFRDDPKYQQCKRKITYDYTLQALKHNKVVLQAFNQTVKRSKLQHQIREEQQRKRRQQFQFICRKQKSQRDQSNKYLYLNHRERRIKKRQSNIYIIFDEEDQQNQIKRAQMIQRHRVRMQLQCERQPKKQIKRRHRKQVSEQLKICKQKRNYYIQNTQSKRYQAIYSMKTQNLQDQLKNIEENQKPYIRPFKLRPGQAPYHISYKVNVVCNDLKTSKFIYLLKQANLSSFVQGQFVIDFYVDDQTLRLRLAQHLRYKYSDILDLYSDCKPEIHGIQMQGALEFAKVKTANFVFPLKLELPQGYSFSYKSYDGWEIQQLCIKNKYGQMEWIQNVYIGKNLQRRNLLTKIKLFKEGFQLIDSQWLEYRCKITLFRQIQLCLGEFTNSIVPIEFDPRVVMVNLEDIDSKSTVGIIQNWNYNQYGVKARKLIKQILSKSFEYIIKAVTSVFQYSKGQIIRE